MGLERRLAALEASLAPRTSTGARERLGAKIASIAEAHRVRRGRGGDDLVDLHEQSVASLLALTHSYPNGTPIPFDVAYMATRKARALNPIAAKLVQQALERKGYDRGV